LLTSNFRWSGQADHLFARLPANQFQPRPINQVHEPIIVQRFEIGVWVAYIRIYNPVILGKDFQPVDKVFHSPNHPIIPANARAKITTTAVDTPSMTT
jgi:hypothetical protein